MWLPYKILFVFIHFLLLPLNMFFILALLLYKLLVCLFAKIFKDFEGPIPGPSTVFIGDQLWHRPHSTIIAGMELNRNTSMEEAAKIFQAVYDLKDEKGQRYYRELGYSLVKYLGYGFWKQVPNFNIRDRIHIVNKNIRPDTGSATMPASDILGDPNISSSSLPQSPVQDEVPLTSVIEGILRQPYDKDQPLWDVYVIHDYKGRRNRSLVLIRFHHLLADGISFVKLFFALTGSPTLPETFVKATTAMKIWDKLSTKLLVKIRTVLTLVTVGFIEYFNEIMCKNDKHAMHYNEKGKFRSNGNWICSMGKQIDMREMKLASKSYGCSITHIILAGICGGMDRYFDKYHRNDKFGTPEGIHFIVPLPIPGHPNLRLTNHWSFVKIHAKFGIGSTEEKLQYFQEETVRNSLSTLPIVTAFIFQYISGLLPAPLAIMLGGVRAFTIVLSNVVGPQDNRLLGESEITDWFFFMPISQESMALGAGVISSNGGIRICLTADSGCIPDRSHLDDMVMMMNEEVVKISETRKSASVV